MLSVTSQVLALICIPIFTLPPLIHTALTDVDNRDKEEYALDFRWITILAGLLIIILSTSSGIVIHEIIYGSEESLYLGSTPGIISILYWISKARIGAKYSEIDRNFLKSSNENTRWREASFSFENAERLVRLGKYMRAYYNFSNAKARFDYISEIEDNTTRKKNAKNLKKASYYMMKYCESASAGRERKAEGYRKQATRLIKVIGFSNEYRSCRNCGKKVHVSDINQFNGIFLCNDCMFRKSKNEQKQKNKRRKKSKSKNKNRKSSKKNTSNKSRNKNKSKSKRKRRNKSTSNTKNSGKRKKSKNKKKKNRINKNDKMSPSQARKVLGVSSKAGEKEIKEAYRERVKETHPDTNPDKDTEEFKKVTEAKNVLLD
jgi:hypothetical protein